jgi:4-carboxymuconolactone decarboxylase
MAHMSQEERVAARVRVMTEIGLEGKTPPGGRPGIVDAPPGSQVSNEREIMEITGNFGYGEVWGRPGLPIKVRSYMTVALLTALRATDEIETHINIALNLGITPEEIHEVLLHAGVYGGLPSWNHASNVARKVFLERGIITS